MVSKIKAPVKMFFVIILNVYAILRHLTATGVILTARAVDAGRKTGAGKKPDRTRWNLLRDLCKFYIAETGLRPTACYGPGHEGSSVSMRMLFAIVEAAALNVKNEPRFRKSPWHGRECRWA